MKSISSKIPFLLFALTLFGCVSVALAQPTPIPTPIPTPRPLSAESQKRRSAATDFERGFIFVRSRQKVDAARALESFRRSQKLYDDLGDGAASACAALGAGISNSVLGNNTDAALDFELALAVLRRTEEKNLTAQTLSRLGRLYNALVGKRMLIDYQGLTIERPRRGFDRDGNRIDTRFSRLGDTYYVQYFNQTFGVYVEPERESSSDDSRFAGSNDPPVPVSYLKEVLKIWRANGPASLQVATQVKMMENWSAGERPTAIFYGKLAVNNYQILRATIQKSGFYRARPYLNQLTDKYRFLADLLIQNGQFSHADQVLRMLKQEEYSEFVMRDASEIKNLSQRVTLKPEELEILARYLAISDQVAGIGRQVQMIEDKERILKEQKSELPVDERERYRELTAKLNDANAAFRIFLENSLKQEAGDPGIRAIDLDREIQDRLAAWGNGTVMLYTVVTDDRYRVVLTTPKTQIDGKTEISSAVLRDKIFEFRKQLQDSKTDPRILGKQLYDILVKPIERELKASGAKTLVWSLDSVLRYIPLAALSPDGSSYLVESYQNVLLTSQTRSAIFTSDDNWRAVGLGVSEKQIVELPENNEYSIILNELPGTKTELMAIIRDESATSEKGILEGKRFLDGDFTLLNLTRSLAARQSSDKKDFNVAHFASHFRLGANWNESFLLLGNSQTLTLEEISTSPALSFVDFELVTLSACKTAVASESGGNEVESLADAIQNKGGKAVLASLWDVVDDSTSELMIGFYRIKQERRGMTKAEALQRAQIQMIETGRRSPAGTNSRSARFSHPYYWSPFVLIGNWR